MTTDSGLQNTVVVNTCAVTAEAVRHSKQHIRKLRRDNPHKQIIVTGCAAQTEPETFAAMPEVDLVLGNHEKMQPGSWQQPIEPPDFITQDPSARATKVKVDDIMAVRETAGHLIDGFGTRSRAYVQIQNGCDHRCTFCIIPFGRGNSRSVAAGVIVEQIKRLTGRGFQEIVLTGVDLTSWGLDLPGTHRLGDLVQRILTLVPGLARLRISSIDSIEADPALIDAMVSAPRLMPHLHLSLQAGDSMILKRMKRRHTPDDAIDFCQMMRAARPDIVFGADIIAGFPTETEAMFENGKAMIRACGLTWLHVFPYSARHGTPAARMPQLERPLVKARAAQLRHLGNDLMQAHLKQQMGRSHNILMETPRMGRTEGFCPAVFDNDQSRGDIIRAQIIGSDGDHLSARVQA